MSKFSTTFSVFTAAAVSVWLGACGSEASDPPPADDATLSQLESELGAAQGSLAGALEEAKACFSDFKDCRQAGNADCVNGLKECLPEPQLGGGLAGRFGFGGGLLPLPGLGRGATPVGGAGNLPVDPEELLACKDDLRAGVGQQQDPAALGEAFKECVGEAFEDLFAGVCERIADACAGAGSSRLCERLSEKCDDSAASP